MNKIFLYGISNFEGRYEIVEYSFIETGSLTINTLKQHASWLKCKNQRIEHVYAIDSRCGLYHEYTHTKRINTFVGNLTFKDTLEREGLLLI